MLTFPAAQETRLPARPDHLRPLSAAAADAVPTWRWSEASLLAAVCAVAVVLAAKGITRTALPDDGDTPRFLMNGVFLLDFLRDHAFAHPLDYAYRYFARYPALSLGHHPLLTPLVEVPFFALFGVSVIAARASVLATMVAMLIVWHLVMRRTFGAPLAIASCVVLATSPGLIVLAQAVLAEPLTLCLIVLAFFFMERYCATGSRADAVGFLIAVVASVYAKQLAVLVFPVYAFQLGYARGARRLISWPVLGAVAAIGLAVAPLVPLSLKYSHFNVQIITEFVDAGDRSQLSSFVWMMRAIAGQVAWPVAGVACVSAVAALRRGDRRVWPFVVWIASVYAGLAALGVRNPRFACYALPAIAALAVAGLEDLGRSRPKRAWAVAVAAIVAYQTIMTAAREVPDGAAYESAARYVTEHPLGDSVLYWSPYDSGYFTFFVRQHDPARRLVVLRADKLLVTSRMSDIAFDTRVADPAEIRALLNRYGVGYVVSDTRPTTIKPLEWLQNLAAGPAFVERERVALGRAGGAPPGTALGVYEYRDRRAADRTARLTLDLPLIGESIGVTFGDLLEENGPAGAQFRRSGIPASR